LKVPGPSEGKYLKVSGPSERKYLKVPGPSERKYLKVPGPSERNQPVAQPVDCSKMIKNIYILVSTGKITFDTIESNIFLKMHLLNPMRIKTGLLYLEM
jgi:hypothetical protein